MSKEHKQSAVLLGKYCTRLMSGSYVCGFDLMKREYHEIDIAVVKLVKSGRNKQEKVKTTFSNCLCFLSTLEKNKLFRVPAWIRTSVPQSRRRVIY